MARSNSRFRLPSHDFNEPLSGLYWQIVVEPDGPVLRSRSLWDAVLDLPPDRLATGEAHRHTIQGPGGASLLAIERQVVLPPDLGGETIRAAVAIDRLQICAAVLAFASDSCPRSACSPRFWCWPRGNRSGRPRAARRGPVQLAAVVAGRPGAWPEDAADGPERRCGGTAGSRGHPPGRRDRERHRRHAPSCRTRAGAGADRPSGAGGPTPPVAPVIEQVVACSADTAGARLSWAIDVADGLGVRMDAQDLTEILGNLAENAATWAAGTVRIEGRHDGSDIMLRVEDDGPGVPGDRINAALARGGRLDESRPGTGLGLAIVGDLAEAHGGSLSLGRSALGGLSRRSGCRPDRGTGR